MSMRPLLQRLRPLLFLPPVLAGAGLLVLAIAGREAPTLHDEAEAATTVRVLTVSPIPFVPRVTGFGVVEPARSWTATAQVAGQVAGLSESFRRGGRVAFGEAIARIADADYLIARAQAEAQLAALDARLAELDMAVENARASLAIEEAGLSLSERELDRQRDLVARGTAPTATVEAQERQTLTQRARVQDLRNTIALHPDQRHALEQERAAAAAALERAKLDLERTIIRAPFDARVAETAIEQDQFVTVGTRLGVLHGTDRAEIDVQLPQSRMRDFVRVVFGERAAADPRGLEQGDAAARLDAEIRLRFQDEAVTWPAKVSRPSASLDPPARSFGAILSVTDPLGGDPAAGRPPLFTGLFLEARIIGPAITEALVLPRGAIRNGAVFLAGPEDRLHRKLVTISMTADGAALVTGGLSPGDRVVLTDLPAATEGMLLSPVEDGAAAERLRDAAVGSGS